MIVSVSLLGLPEEFHDEGKGTERTGEGKVIQDLVEGLFNKWDLRKSLPNEDPVGLI